MMDGGHDLRSGDFEPADASDELKEALLGLLKVQPAQRWTLEMLLTSPWMQRLVAATPGYLR